jgi:phosphatidylserine/phosphatidylglycerophosphate/cardiolipin synthase-like enzyme
LRPSPTPLDEVRCAEWLIDNDATYTQLLGAIRAAQRSVWIAQLAFDPDCRAYVADDGAICSSADGELLTDALLAVAAAKHVTVRVLLNASLLLDTAKTLRRRFHADADRGARIVVRGISRFPRLLHAKFVVIDGNTAFLIGSPFVNGYWDDAGHAPSDARRPSRELGGRPVHDVSLRFRGPAVKDLAAIFAELWNEAAHGRRDGDMVHPPPRPPSEHTAAVRIIGTVPPRILPRAPSGATEILESILAGIARAKSLIYIEHQYLSARPVVAALVDALRRAPALEVVLVLNQNADVTAYRGWQNARLAQSGLLGHPRVGVFALWCARRTPSGARAIAINQLFVHSKVVTIDDEWATVGSANLDGVSLHSYGDDFDGWLGRRLFRGVRNFDVNAVLADGIDGAPSTGLVADLRTRLWSEHLGRTPAAVSARPAGGWLSLWRACAADNVASLNASIRGRGCASPMRGFALPYSGCSRPAQQLAAVGVDATALDLRFDPGWLELHLSPNWVRNMFS